ncbi:MAG: fumarylacetoacetate hydrolase family protein [Phenylobacterium sp.]|uniref:fumarylacetoacetate hydrolase family protein n=1 Tax=Phenylobacterium sp. TaxID=1871053 RepID=UPI003BB64606
MTDPSASWVSGWDTSGFPADALPYGVCDAGQGPYIGVAIGDQVFDLAKAAAAGLLPDIDPAAVSTGTLNRLMRQGPARLQALRARLHELLQRDGPSIDRNAAELCLTDQSAVLQKTPVHVGDFTDFYASEHHALRSMRAVAPDAQLAANWYAMPVGYSSRAGAIVGDGVSIVRPSGQQRVAGQAVFAPSRMLDYEAEIGLIVCADSQHGRPVPIGSASDYLFGVSLLNDWSARDIQRWESQPLGPHLGKSFATQLGPWVLPLPALAGATWPNPTASRCLPYLRHAGQFLFDIEVEVTLASAAMRSAGLAPVTICQANARDLYWDAAQMIAHVTSNGAPLRVGDVLGTGTISGPALEQSACLLERTSGGRAPLELPDGTRRSYLEDGDELALHGQVRRRDGVVLSLGRLRATVGPADDRQWAVD